MKKIIIPVVTLVLFACGESAPKEDANNPSSNNTDSISVERELVCKMVYDAEKTQIGFGGFKTTDKKEVKGVFEEFEVSNTNEGDNGVEVFKGASISIKTSSTETKDAGRNERIVAEYFGNLSNAESINGSIISIENDTAVVSLTLNDISKEVKLNFSQVEDTVKLEGNINVVELFNAQAAVEGLNKVCEGLHKGADGVSKTWEDVNIHVYSILKESCK